MTTVKRRLKGMFSEDCVHSHVRTFKYLHCTLTKLQRSVL